MTFLLIPWLGITATILCIGGIIQKDGGRKTAYLIYGIAVVETIVFYLVITTNK